MAIYLDDLDRIIIVDDVAKIYNGLYADSLEELVAFCRSHRIRTEYMSYRPYTEHNVAWVDKQRIRKFHKFPMTMIRHGERPWVDNAMIWD
jgi:hypothetical protein